MERAVRSTLAGDVLAAAATAFAGVVHLVLAPDHLSAAWPLGVGFALVGGVQLAGSSWLLSFATVGGPGRRGARMVVAGVNLFAALSWTTVVTVGLPWTGGGSPDLAGGLTTALEVTALVAIVTGWIVRDVELSRTTAFPLVVAGLVAVFVGGSAALAATHAHDHGHDHGHDRTETIADPHIDHDDEAQHTHHDDEAQHTHHDDEAQSRSTSG